MLRRVVRRQRARADVEAAALHYLDGAGLAVAMRFVASVEAAIERAVAHPAAGSTRYAELVGQPGLRFWIVKGFPYLVFYQDRGDWLDVWRVLHAERDIPAWLREHA